MNWQMIRNFMDEAALACIHDGGVMDDCAKALLAFVPDRPNDPADAEWLRSRKGWTESSDKGLFLHDATDIWFDQRDGTPEIELHDEAHGISIPKPTRMQVALFEAALAAGVKNG